MEFRTSARYHYHPRRVGRIRTFLSFFVFCCIRPCGCRDPRGYPAGMAANCVRPHRRPVPAELHRFTIDGVRHAVALCPAHHRELQRALRDVLSPYLVDSARSPRRSPVLAVDPERVAENAAIRVWAERNGLRAPRRGPIPRDLRAAYEARSTRSTTKRSSRAGVRTGTVRTGTVRTAARTGAVRTGARASN